MPLQQECQRHSWTVGGEIKLLIRENMEFLERNYLSPFATLSENSRGRDREEERKGEKKQNPPNQPTVNNSEGRLLETNSCKHFLHCTLLH